MDDARRHLDGGLALIGADVRDDRVFSIRAQLNPDKLEHVAEPIGMV